MILSARSRRMQAVKLADALNEIEGTPVSEYAKELSRRWASGELTGEEMKAALMAYHQQVAENDR